MAHTIKKLSIAMAGGGTGGHVFPIKSLIQYIEEHFEYRQHIDKIYWFGSKQSLEEKVSQELQKSPKLVDMLRFVPLYSGKYRRESYRKSKLKNIPDFFLFLFGIFQSIFYLLRYRIDVVFCKGGYVALPVVLAAALLRKKIVVHESDTRPGLVNKIASHFAHKVFTGFDGVFKKSETIGQILSDDIVTQAIPEQSSKTMILVVGGSQGSKRLYQNILHILEFTPELQSGYEFFVILGLANKDMLSLFDKFDCVHAYDFVSQKEMGELCNSCDIAITRGGTTALAEQKLYDLKQIIVPIPRTHDQYDNAKRYVRVHNDILINQRDADFESQLAKAIKHFKGFKKISQPKDKLAIIAGAKVLVWKSLLDR